MNHPLIDHEVTATIMVMPDGATRSTTGTLTAFHDGDPSLAVILMPDGRHVNVWMHDGDTLTEYVKRDHRWRS